jgi:hypothetical protein
MQVRTVLEIWRRRIAVGGGRREEDDAGPTTVGMQQGERILGMHTLWAGLAKCRSGCSNCWSLYLHFEYADPYAVIAGVRLL